jgi:cell shape-determining protein MreC
VGDSNLVDGSVKDNLKTYFSASWDKITKHFTGRFTDGQSVGYLIESKLMRDNIFNEIYAKFARGEKLKRYDFYVREKAAIKYLNEIEEERKRLLS